MGNKVRSPCVGIVFRLLILLLVVALVIPQGTLAQDQWETEPNDAQASATPIKGSSINGKIVAQGGIDWFSKEFTKGDTVSFALTKEKVRQPGLNMTLHAPNGSQIAKASAFEGVGRVTVETTAPQTGKYYVEIEQVQPSKDTIQYTVHTPADAAPTPQTKTPSATTGTQQASEPNDERANAVAIKGEQISGKITDSSDTDWYSFQATKGKNVSLLFNKPAKSPYLLFKYYAPDEDDTYRAYDRLNRDDTREQVVLSIKRTGTYYIKITSGSSQLSKYGNKYTIHLSGEAPPLQATPSSDTGDDTSQSGSNTSDTTTTADSSAQTETTASTDTSTTNTPDGEKSTSTFGPGFTSVGALIALLSTALIALRRR